MLINIIKMVIREEDNHSFSINSQDGGPNTKDGASIIQRKNEDVVLYANKFKYQLPKKNFLDLLKKMQDNINAGLLMGKSLINW